MKSEKEMKKELYKKPKLFENIYWWCYRRLRPIIDLKYLPREIKWKVQRIKKGYSDCDVWGFDYYLTSVILGGLRRLKKTKIGIPATAHTGSTNYDYNKKRWDKILDTMIYAFEVEDKILNGDPEWWYIPSKDFTRKEYNDRKKQFGKVFYVMTLEEVKKYELGWKYFQEYFHALWD